MEDKIERLLHEVERLLTHIEHSIAPETVVVEQVRQLVKEIKQERADLAGDFSFHIPKAVRSMA